VLEREVLVLELLTVDGLTTGALSAVSVLLEELIRGVEILTLPAVKSPP